MVVRFDSRAVQDTIAHRNDPIGVEGDKLSSVPGGVSESTAIVGAVKQSLDKLRDEGKLGTDVPNIEEEQMQQEPGPELDLHGLQKAREKAAEGQKEAGLR